MQSTPQARAAIRAAKNCRKWGAYAARRFAQRCKVPASMLIIAMRVELGRQA